MGLILVASIDQLRTRQVLPGFWLVTNLSAVIFAILGIGGAFAGRGWSRLLLIAWAALLIFGMLAVVASTIP
jgi:hypothetical protein